MCESHVLDVLRLVKDFLLHTAMELHSLQPDPLFRHHGYDVMSTNHLFALLPHVIDAQVNIRHPCNTIRKGVILYLIYLSTK